MKLRLAFALLLASVGMSAFATTFVVPTDSELVDRSTAIVIGRVEGSFVQESHNTIETVWEVRVERAIKGRARSEDLLRVTTLGGVLGDRGAFVPAEAQFASGERVLLFLTAENGEWRVTDMTLGRFRFATSTTGERLLVRNMEDVFGWDHAGRVPEEKIRREEGFLRFVEARVHHQPADLDYTVDARQVSVDSSSEPFAVQANAATTYRPSTYTSWVSSQPTRWPNMSAGVPFWKRSDQDIPGASDGGVSVIQNGLAAWNNECGSVINLTFAGERATASANHDGVNVVEFNDPQGRVSGSWNGAGTIAITFLSFAGTHSFDSQTWWNITDADVVFQDGFPATHAAFATAMTHELGHAIGWRHSNQHYDGGGTCNSSVEECTTAAIMNATVAANYGYTLQPFDVHAAQLVYPGGSCSTPPPSTPPPSTGLVRGDFNGDGNVDLLWRNYASGAINVWLMSGSTYLSSVNIGNVADGNWHIEGVGDFNGDSKSDIVWRNYATGVNSVWFMNGTSYVSNATLDAVSDTNWRIETVNDFNGDGYDDLIWRNYSTGAVHAWFMRGTTHASSAELYSVTDRNWRIEGAGDFNRDGHPDLVWRNYATGAVNIWYLNGTTFLSGPSLYSVTDANWEIGAVGDYNRDGNQDLVWRNYATGAVNVWFLSGVTYLSGPSLYSVTDPNWRIEGPR